MKVKTLLVLAAIFVSAVNAAFAQSDERFDLVINNARIVDGTGNPWFHGSIGVRDGKIIKISRFELRNAAKTIDANGQIVAPGFIDVHTHGWGGGILTVPVRPGERTIGA